MPAPASSPLNIAHSVRHTYLTGLAISAVGAIFFSAKAIVGKLLYAEGLDAIDVVALRMLISGPVFMLILAWSWSRAPRMTSAQIMKVSALGLMGYYVASTLDFKGLEYVSAGLERLILYLTPTMVLLISRFTLGRRITPIQILSMLFAYAGIVLVFWHDLSLGGPNVALGASLVLIAAAMYAVYLIYSGELLGIIGSTRLVALAMSASSVPAVLQFFLFHPADRMLEFDATVWSLSLINASLCTVIPVFLIMYGVARAGAGPAAQAGMIGPASTLFLAWWILDEPLTPLQLAGTALVLAGVFLLSVRRKTRSPDEAQRNPGIAG